jgi:hypothetical protein
MQVTEYFSTNSDVFYVDFVLQTTQTLIVHICVVWSMEI